MRAFFWKRVIINQYEVWFEETRKGYRPQILNEGTIPLLLTEKECNKACEILNGLKINPKMSKEIFKMLIIGALKIAMTQGMNEL